MEYLYYEAQREDCDLMIQLLESAIKEGVFQYQFHIYDKKYAPELFINMFRPALDEGTLMLVAGKKEMIGFACYRATKFCGNEFCDGMMTYVKPDYRGEGISEELRNRLFDQEKMRGRIIRYSVASGNYIGFISSVNAAKKLGVEIKCIGQTYEGKFS